MSVLTTSSKNKRIAKNSVYLYIRMFLTMAVSLYTVRITIETLSIEDYGLYGAVSGIILSFGFISGVLTNASQRFFAVEIGHGEEGKLKDTFNTLFYSYLGVTVLIVLILETVGVWFLQNKMTIPPGRDEAALYVFQFAIMSFVITLLANPYQALIIAHEKMNLYAYMSILDVILKLAVVYALVIFKVDKLVLYAILIFTVSIITNSVYVIYCHKKYETARLDSHIDKTILKKIFSYNSWTLFGTLAGTCNTQGMNILLNIFFGTFANAAYSISSHVYHSVATFANNFFIAVKPALMKEYAATRYDYVSKLFSFSSKALFLLVFIIILPIIANTKEILQLWLGEVGEYMVIFVQLSLIYTIILIISYPITAVVQAEGSVKFYHGVVDGVSLLALPIMYLLFHLGFDAYYSYIVSIIVFGTAHILRLYVLKRVFPYFSIRNYIRHFIIPSIFEVLVSVFIAFAIKKHMPNTVFGTLSTCILIFLIASTLGWFIVLSKSERTKILKLILKK